MSKKINVLFVCGYGVGSSVMCAGMTKKELDKLGVESEVEHTSAGEAQGFQDWVDIVAVSKKLIHIVNLDAFPNKDVVEIENIMDGKGIAEKIYNIAKEKFPESINGN
ncbi:PTS sugar transporter subunit IIB [uncultured Anaerococcus sp.]|uniref:PTS sugar transporter subunit IIB n=1 Tax=uncultured Anaerococcus sp. TaxID=293428 RepID=UPI0028897D87|nr:PTS sugar transporter subunit IIB [uncultured Anaerococcus sp.]